MIRNQEPSLDSLIAGYSQILAKDPHSTVFVSLCDAYLRSGRLEEALQVASRGVQALPWFGPGHAILGKIQAQLGNLNGALQSFNKALTLDGESLVALKGLARIYIEKNRPEIARQVLERALQVFPDNSSVRHMLSQLPSDGEDEDEDLETLQDIPPISTVAIAEVFVKQGLLPQACQVYRDILQAEPGNEAVRQKLEELEKSQGRMEETLSLEKPEIQDIEPIAGRDALTILKSWLERIRQRRQQYVS